MARRLAVVATRSLAADLDRLGRFLSDDARFDAFLELIETRASPLLASQPGVGRPFLGRQLNAESRAILARVRERLGGGELRELVLSPCLILYLHGRDRVSLLALRHQREVGYELRPRR